MPEELRIALFLFSIFLIALIAGVWVLVGTLAAKLTEMGENGNRINLELQTLNARLHEANQLTNLWIETYSHWNRP